jgi:methylamine--corrinoid protein Co-methyltransferase
MSRLQANEMVLSLVALYQNDLDQRPVGKRFDQVYDPVRVAPTEEWLGVYEAVKGELRELGLDLNSAAAHACVGRSTTDTNQLRRTDYV